MSKYKDTADTVKGIVEAVPIYQDLLQPSVQELGKGLHTLSKTIHIALSPVSALVWGYEQIREYIQTSLEDKLANIPRENIIYPMPEVAVPALEALRYTGHRKELREMFSNLLATSMNIELAKKAHPSFVEIIKQINSDEAKILMLIKSNISIPVIKVRAQARDSVGYAEPLTNFSLIPYEAECEYPEMGPSYLDNIARLGLINLSYTTYNTFENAYTPLENHAVIKKMRIEIESFPDKRPEIIRGTINRNPFGQNFFETCVQNR